MHRFAAAIAAMAVVGFAGALTVQGFTGSAAAQTATDVSSQNRNNQGQRAAPHAAPRAAPQVSRPAPHMAPRPAPHMAPRMAPRAPQPHVTTRPMQPRAINRPAPPHVITRPAPPRATNRPASGPRVITRQPAAGSRTTVVRHGPRIGSRISSTIRLRGRNFTVIRGPRYVYWHGRRRALVPLAALAAITIGAIAYAPYAYIPVAADYCTGYTDDGCELQWTDVPTAEGDVIPQCVAYCPAE